jgi:acyl-coenzyme A thioesterase 13
MTAKNTLDFVQKCLLHFCRPNGFDAQLFSKLQVVDAEYGRAVCRMPVEAYHLNRMATLHGGVIASLVDICGSLAIASTGDYLTGVSTDINVSYLSASRLGDVITIDARCMRKGKTLAYTTVDILHQDRLLAQGRHTKFIAKAKALQERLEKEGKVPAGQVASNSILDALE